MTKNNEKEKNWPSYTISSLAERVSSRGNTELQTGAWTKRKGGHDEQHERSIRMITDSKTESEPQVRCDDGLGRKRRDPDISALKACVLGLNKSTSRRMLEANLRFLWDRYITHPSPELPEHLRPNNTLCREAGQKDAR